jgi:putative endonuclease
MSNNTELQTKAVKAATRFCERRGYEILACGWEPKDSEGVIDMVADDEGAIVFIDVTATSHGEGGFAHGHTERRDMEVLVAGWLAENTPEGDILVKARS